MNAGHSTPIAGAFGSWTRRQSIRFGAFGHRQRGRHQLQPAEFGHPAQFDAERPVGPGLGGHERGAFCRDQRRASRTTGTSERRKPMHRRRAGRSSPNRRRSCCRPSRRSADYWRSSAGKAFVGNRILKRGDRTANGFRAPASGRFSISWLTLDPTERSFTSRSSLASREFNSPADNHSLRSSPQMPTGERRVGAFRAELLRGRLSSGRRDR